MIIIMTLDKMKYKDDAFMFQMNILKGINENMV